MAHTTPAAMIRTVALLALIASASAIWPFDSEPTPWKSGLSQTFSINMIDSNSFAKLPQILEQALKKGWVEVQGPATPAAYADLRLYMKLSEPTTGLYFDGEFVAGLLISLPVSTTKPHFNPTEQGLKLWNCSIDGETKTYWTSSFFFVSEDKSTRHYDENEVIQDDKVTFVSTYGNLDTMPKDLKVIKENEESVWKIQNCLILMGLHYYHSMTKSTTCDKPFVPYFGLYDNKTNQLIGIGFMMMGDCEGPTMEHPNKAAVEMIVNNGPSCLYTMVEEYKVCTRHVYFVDNPRIITC